MGNPTYITVVTSTGSSPWWITNWQGLAPFNIGLAIRANSTSWQIDVTMDDPTGVFPSSAGPTVFQSSQCAGSGSSVVGIALASGSSGNFVGSITMPIAALRLTNNSTQAATMTVLQSGIG